MMAVTADLDPDVLATAARAMNVPPGLPPDRQLAAIVRAAAGRRPAGSRNGAVVTRAGRHWETTIVEHAQARGLPWDRAPKHRDYDLLDVAGCWGDGWLIGAKSVQPGSTGGEKLWAAMDQCHRAMSNLKTKGFDIQGITPFQIVRRPGAPAGRSYAVTEYDWLLDLATERRRRR